MEIDEEEKGKKLDNEIFEYVVKKLEDKDSWEPHDDHTTARSSIHHKTENICLQYDMDWFDITHKLTEPGQIRAPKKYNKQIQKLVRNILGFSKNKEKQFVLDYVIGKYSGYIDIDRIPKEHHKTFQKWLDHEVTKENYVLQTHTYRADTIYFKRESDHAFMVLKWL